MVATGRGRLGVGILAVSLLLSACGGTGPAATSKKATSPTQKAQASPPAEVTIPFNMVAFLAPGKTGPRPGFSEYGDLDNQTAPPAGPYTVTVGGTKVTFNFPATKSTDKDSLAISYGEPSPTLKVTPGHYGHVYFLAAVAGGPQPAEAVLAYSDGSTQQEPVGFDDWCTVEVGGTLVPGTYAAWQGQKVIAQSNGSTATVSKNGYSGSAQGCGLYVSSVPVNESKTLTGVQIDNTLHTVPAALAADITQVQTAKHSGRINIIAVTAQ